MVASPIPDHWDLVPLHSAAEFLDGQRVPIKSKDRQAMAGDIPYYGASGIIDWVNDFIFDEPLILLAEDGANILTRNQPIAFKVTGKCWVNNHAHILRPREGWSIDFIAEYLESLDYSKFSTGSAQPKLNQRVCRTILVARPPLPEQKKIAEILGSVDEAIQKTQAVISQTERVKKGLLQTLLTRGMPGRHTRFKKTEIGEIPADWELVPLESALSQLIDYRGKAPPKSDSGVPLLTAKNIRKGYLDWTSREFIPEEKYSEWMVRGIAKPGAVLFTTEAPLGNVALLPTEKVALAQRVLCLEADGLTLVNPFLYWLLQSPAVQKRLRKNATGSTASGIRQRTFRKMLFPIPSILEQEEISGVLDRVWKRSLSEKANLNQIGSVKRGLMNDLLTGKVRVKV